MPTLRGVLERTKQRLHIGDRTFKPTPNVRNPAMLQEAEDFSLHMISFKTYLARYEKHISSFLAVVPLVCRTNLPRVWEAVDNTNICEPVHTDIASKHPYRTGGNSDDILMADAAEILRRRFDGIIRPIDRWLESMQVVKRRMRRLDNLRVQVDSRRREVHRRYMKALKGLSVGEAAALQAQTEIASSHTTAGAATRGRGASTAGDVESEVLEGGYEEEPRHTAADRAFDMEPDEESDMERVRAQEDYMREALSQQRKLEAVADSYREQEQLVYEQLSGLVRDSAYFKSYMAAAFLVVKDTLQATLTAMGPCKRPLPGFSERESETSGYGRLADIRDLIEALPPIVKAGGRDLPPGMRSPLAGTAPDTIRPKKVTAQPLRVAADDVSAPSAKYGFVEPVVRPASNIPADTVVERHHHHTGHQGARYTEASGGGGGGGGYGRDVARTGISGGGGTVGGEPYPENVSGLESAGLTSDVGKYRHGAAAGMHPYGVEQGAYGGATAR